MKKFIFILALTCVFMACSKDDDKTSTKPSNGSGVSEPDVFSVSENRKVYFSPGNLQYQPSTKTWRFAENQYSYVGDEDNGNVYINSIKCKNNSISSSYQGWIDLFGWGTSGYNGKNPYMRSTTDTDYGNETANITDSNYDWGLYNGIFNPAAQSTDPAGTWRTLTSSEWRYLLSGRADAKKKCGLGCIDNSVNGLIILPDAWTLPEGYTFNNGYSAFNQNTYTVAQWKKMEANGAIFLPAGGYRAGSNAYRANQDGRYWATTSVNQNVAYGVYFYENKLESNNSFGRSNGICVRLVRNKK